MNAGRTRNEQQPIIWNNTAFLFRKSHKNIGSLNVIRKAASIRWVPGELSHTAGWWALCRHSLGNKLGFYIECCNSTHKHAGGFEVQLTFPNHNKAAYSSCGKQAVSARAEVTPLTSQLKHCLLNPNKAGPQAWGQGCVFARWLFRLNITLNDYTPGRTSKISHRSLNGLMAEEHCRIKTQIKQSGAEKREQCA